MREWSRPPSQTRVVKYDYTGEFDEVRVEEVLERARRDGIVTQYDTGRGRIVWFEGPPGKLLRKVRESVEYLVRQGVAK